MLRTNRVPAVAAVFLSACAQMLGVPSDVRTSPWWCLGSASDADAPRVSSATVRVQACDFVSDCAASVTGLRARLCAKRDVGCSNPILEEFEDTDGLFEFQVPTNPSGFDGYLQVSSATELCTNKEVFGNSGPALCALAAECDPASPNENCQVPVYASALLFFNPPITGDGAQTIPLPLLSTVALPAVVEAAGANLDPTAGNLFITAMDCDGVPAEGVTYSIDQHEDVATQLYVDNGVVSDTILQTDLSGIGGFVGVPPGFAEVTGYNRDFQEVGKIGVQSAPFTMTYSALVPPR